MHAIPRARQDRGAPRDYRPFRLVRFGRSAHRKLALLGRVDFIQPVLLRVSEKSDPDSYAAINLHFDGTQWKLSGIELPKPIVRMLAASLPVK